MGAVIDAMNAMNNKFIANGASIIRVRELAALRKAGVATPAELEELAKASVNGDIVATVGYAEATDPNNEVSKLAAEARAKEIAAKQQVADTVTINAAAKTVQAIKTTDPREVKVRLGGTDDSLEASRRTSFKRKVATPAIAAARAPVKIG